MTPLAHTRAHTHTNIENTSILSPWKQDNMIHQGFSAYLDNEAHRPFNTLHTTQTTKTLAEAKSVSLQSGVYTQTGRKSTQKQDIS